MCKFFSSWGGPVLSLPKERRSEERSIGFFRSLLNRSSGCTGVGSHPCWARSINRVYVLPGVVCDKSRRSLILKGLLKERFPVFARKS